MADPYAKIAKMDSALQERLADILEIRAGSRGLEQQLQT